VSDQSLDVRDDPAGVHLIPALIQLLCDKTELSDEIAG